MRAHGDSIKMPLVVYPTALRRPKRGILRASGHKIGRSIEGTSQIKPNEEIEGSDAH